MDDLNAFHLGTIDQILVVAYLFCVLFVGLRYAKSYRNDVDDYLLMGRKLSLPAFVATLVSTWYGGILGIGEFTHRYGILNWVTQGLPYYICAIAFAFFLAPRIQKSMTYTIPDLLTNRYGRRAGLVGSLFVFILVTPASHFLMTGLLFRSIFGIPFWWGFAIAVLFSTFYVFFGGLRSDVMTDILQFFLMFAGFTILVITLFFKFGGWSFLKANLPTSHLSPTGGQSIQTIIVWFFIALWTFVDAGFYQRCSAAKSPNTAKYGILFAIVFWAVFDFLTTSAGLYARAIYPEIEPLMAFPTLGEQVLPVVFRGIFFIALLATIMSTLDSNSFIGAITFGRDFIWRIRGHGNINRFTQIGLIVTVCCSALLVWLLPSVVKIWYLIGTLCVPALFIPLVSTFIPKLRLSSRAAFLSMIVSFFGTLGWLIAGIRRGTIADPLYLLKIQPFFVGFFLSLLIAGIDWIGKYLQRPSRP